MSTHLITHSPPPQAKKLRPCLSPTRGRSERSCWVKPKSVRWEGDEDDGCAVTSYFATWSCEEYDRTPLAPPSEQERSCVLPARGSRCLTSGWNEDDEPVSDDEPEPVLPASPFATPEDSDGESDNDQDEDEWDECYERRRMMFARMCSKNRDDTQPQFEGYRSLSATLTDLLRSVGCDEDDEDEGEEGYATPRMSSTPRDDDYGFGFTRPPLALAIPTIPDVFSRLRQAEQEEAGFRECSPEESICDTPSLVSSADSDIDCSGLASPRGSAVDFLPFSHWKGASPLRDTPDLAADREGHIHP